MKIYIVSYDLATPGGDYSGVEQALSRCAMGEMLHFQKSVWLMASSLTATQIRDEVSQALSEGDKIFVALLEGYDWAGWGTKAKAWIVEHRTAS